jgi:hypothetical protein
MINTSTTLKHIIAKLSGVEVFHGLKPLSFVHNSLQANDGTSI